MEFHFTHMAALIPGVLNLPRKMGEPWFKYLALPVVSLLAGALLKSHYRSDKKDFTKEDFAWGPELVMSACLMMLLLAADRSAAYITTLQSGSLNTSIGLESFEGVLSPIVVFIGNGILLWCLTIWIRHRGWEGADKLHMKKGFVVPLIVGLLDVGASYYFGVL